MYIFKATENTPQKLVLKDSGWGLRLLSLTFFLLCVFAMFWLVGGETFLNNLALIMPMMIIFLGGCFTLIDRQTTITFDGATASVTLQSSSLWFCGRKHIVKLSDIKQAIAQHSNDMDSRKDTYRPALETHSEGRPFKLTPAYEEDKQAVDETVGLINDWLENYRKSWSG